jgi:hypothetical protein
VKISYRRSAKTAEIAKKSKEEIIVQAFDLRYLSVLCASAVREDWVISLVQEFFNRIHNFRRIRFDGRLESLYNFAIARYQELCEVPFDVPRN